MSGMLHATAVLGVVGVRAKGGKGGRFLVVAKGWVLVTPLRPLGVDRERAREVALDRPSKGPP
eukprot:159820-Chlamydomonas_euryale.AAC.4